MIQEWRNSEEYQKFLTSSERVNYIPDEIYLKLIDASESDTQISILEFGTGLGHVAVYLGQYLNKKSNYHIYASDYNEQFLDRLWYTLAQKKVTKVTPFFLPDYSRINFPAWLPKMQYIICSLSLTASNNPKEILETIQSIASENATLHIIEWDGNHLPPEIAEKIPDEKKLNAETLKRYLIDFAYDITFSHVKDEYYNLFSARIP